MGVGRILLLKREKAALSDSYFPVALYMGEEIRVMKVFRQRSLLQRGRRHKFRRLLF
jgi:hypothetical protein